MGPLRTTAAAHQSTPPELPATTGHSTPLSPADRRRLAFWKRPAPKPARAVGKAPVALGGVRKVPVIRPGALRSLPEAPADKPATKTLKLNIKVGGRTVGTRTLVLPRRRWLALQLKALNNRRTVKPIESPRPYKRARKRPYVRTSERYGGPLLYYKDEHRWFHPASGHWYHKGPTGLLERDKPAIPYNILRKPTHLLVA